MNNSNQSISLLYLQGKGGVYMVREELLDKLILESLEVYLKKEDEKLKLHEICKGRCPHRPEKNI